MAYVPGMENVIAVQTAISTIDGQAGQLIYRGYDINDLVFDYSFEEIWHLLLLGDLEAFQQQIQVTLPDSIIALIRNMPKDVSFISIVRSALSATLADMQPSMDLSPDDLLADCVRAASVTPLVIATCHRIRAGLNPVQPKADLTWPANFIYMVTGETPTEDQIMAVTRYMILVADHGLNASTFTARVVTSTGADVGAAVVAAIGALSGPLHGGAPSRVLDMLDLIGDDAKARQWAEEQINAKAKIMGFGHRVYKTHDPRSLALKATAEQIDSERYKTAEAIERIITETFTKLKPGRDIYPNVEYYSAVALEAAGLPRDLFTPTFVAARTVGWTAHIYEQATNNRIMRPRAEYIGKRLIAQA